jgi:hypothetical protein
MLKQKMQNLLHIINQICLERNYKIQKKLKFNFFYSFVSWSIWLDACSGVLLNLLLHASYLHTIHQGKHLFNWSLQLTPIVDENFVVVVRHGYHKRHHFRDSERGCETSLVLGVRNNRIHKDLEWFGMLERTMLRPLFLCCSSKILEYKVWGS